MPSDPELLAPLLESHNVFGRVSPEQKKQFVLALQARGHVVAMTGDGVNDALALKTADLGVAMGNGASATKAVSRIVLLNNSFASFPMLVGEGRRVIANVERVSRLFLTKTTWAMFLAAVFGFMLWSFPFLPRQLSAVDGYTIGIAAFFLALLPNRRRYRPGFLKRSLMFCVPSGLVIGIAVVGLTVAIRAQTAMAAQTQTGISILLSLTGLWVLVTLSRPYDRYRFAITAAMYALFVLAFTIGLVRDFFGFVALTTQTLVTTGLVACGAIVCIEIVNYVVNGLLRDEPN
jgi:cation-transporting ATPase E